MTMLGTRRELTAQSGTAAAAVFIVALLGAYSVASAAIAVFMDDIVRDLGWSRGQIGGGVMMLQVGMASMATVGGRIINRYGARAVVLPVLLMQGLALIALAATGPSIILFYGCLFLIGAGAAGTMALGRVLSGWFLRRRGAALALLGIAVALCGVATPQLAEWLLGRVGWRGSFVLFGLTVLFVSLPVFALFGRERPRALARPGASASDDPDGAPHISAFAAARMPIFWILIGAQAGSIFAMTALSTHGIGIFGEHGLARELGVRGLSLIALGSAAANLLTGLLLDRLGTPRVILPFALVSLIGIALVQFGQSGLVVLLGSLLFGLGAGGEHSMTSYFVTRFFGLRNYSEVYGLMTPIMFLAGAPAAVITGIAFDFAGSYALALVLIDVVLVAAALCFAVLPAFPYPRTLRPAASGSQSPTVETAQPL